MRMVFLPLVLALAACSTTHKDKSEVKEIDTQLEKSQDVNGETLGVRDNSIVIQKKRLLAEELRELQNYTYGLNDEVYGSRKYGSRGLYGVYVDCKADLNAKSLGGTGDLPYVEPAEKIIKEDSEINFGKDENDKLVSVTEEYISERIERFKKYRDKLEKRRAEYELKVRVCKTKLKSARAEAAQKQQ